MVRETLRLEASLMSKILIRLGIVKSSNHMTDGVRRL